MEKKSKYKDPPQYKLIEEIEEFQRKQFNLLLTRSIQTIQKKIKTWTS